ncbi:hypothetical protein BJ944DRAFT_272999 [Cunninghamella echinulata]|nr:hypothetical protein BJ944DRAFT_272999 [Cunninghamella echinulata]
MLASLNNQEDSIMKEQWVDTLPLPPNNTAFYPTHQDSYSNPLTIENRHGTLLSLLDAVYPPTMCFICNTTLPDLTEVENHIATHHNTSKRYLCLHPHCTKSFKSRASLRFHIARTHVIDKKLVPKSDPLYLLYAPTSSYFESITPIASPSPSSSSISSVMVVPQKRKWQRRTKKEINNTIDSEQQSVFLVKTSSSPGLSNDSSTPTPSPSMQLDINNNQPKRRGRPPKIPILHNKNNNNNNDISYSKQKSSIATIMNSDHPLSSSSSPSTVENNIMTESTLSEKSSNEVTSIIPHFKNDISSPSLSTDTSTIKHSPLTSPLSIKNLGPTSISTSNTIATEITSPTKSNSPKVFRLVQQVIPQNDPFPEKKKAVLSLQSKTLLAEKYNPLKCPSCQTGFKRKTNVVKHLVTYHSGEECFQCVYDHCTHPKKFSTREGLVYHILRAHDNQPDNDNDNNNNNNNDNFVESSDNTSIDEDHDQEQEQQQSPSLIENINENKLSENNKKGDGHDNVHNENKNNFTMDKKSTVPITKDRPGRKKKALV